MSVFSAYYIGQILNLTCLLIVAGGASSIALRTGSINLGGEGQVYLGGFVAAIILGIIPRTQQIQFETVSFGAFGVITLFVIAIIAVALVGMFCMALSILLKRKAKIDVLLSSFLLSSALIPVLNYLITNDFRDKSANLLSTVKILDEFKIPKVFSGFSLNISFFLILGFYALAYFGIFKTQKGKAFLLCGTEKEFALYSGFDVEKANNLGLLASGALYSLCGFLAVIGNYYSCTVGFYSLYGWNGLTVALIASKKPILLVPAAFLLSFIYVYAESLSLFSNFDSDLILILQGILLFFITVKIQKRNEK